MTDDAVLLQRHKPRLIAWPQDTRLHRPWKKWLEFDSPRRGDYHPCTAEFFLRFVTQRSRPHSFWSGILGDPEAGPPTGLEALKALAAGANPAAILEWEIDLATIESQDAADAWVKYRSMLDGTPAFQSAMYGRCVRGPDGIGLEYWLLYAYNDAPNRHEGDWEMIALELDASEQPVQAGYASHRSGLRRPWSRVEHDGDTPLVYVARGSHASYFDHQKGGHRMHSPLLPNKGMPPLIGGVLSAGSALLQNLIVVLRLEDQTPTHPDRPGDESINRGVFIEPDLVVLPDAPDLEADPDLWWMRLDCPWGSCHTRLFGDTAPDPPWQQGAKWSQPLEWIRALEIEP